MKQLQHQLLSISKALTELSKQSKAVAKQLARAGKPAAKNKAPAKPRTASKTAGRKAVAVRKAPVTETVLGVVRKNKKGVSIADLKKKTGLGSRQVSNAVYKLTKRGEVASISRGVYVTK